MAEFRRKMYDKLLEWKNKVSRKPLIVRGARQVGKSTLVKQFSTEFEHYISLNLERSEHREIFEDFDQVKDIVKSLLFRNEIPENSSSVLIFIDEIQESPKAIQQLRFFHEDFPDLFVITAGSLLEFAFKDIESFPVGRVEQLVLHPFSFEEFLNAVESSGLTQYDLIPTEKFVHKTLLNLFHQYAMVGGMPEAIKHFVETKSLQELPAIYNNLWLAYQEDANKYGRNRTERTIINHIMRTAPSEKDRISFNGFGNSSYRSREVKDGLDALDKARVIRLIYPTTSIKMPLIVDFKRKPRLQFLDTGLLNYAAGLTGDMIGLKSLDDFYRGKIIMHLAAQELESIHYLPSFRPNFWVREKANSNAEVDLVYTHSEHVIPIEVKAGKTGSLRSLHQFIEQSSCKLALRISSREYSEDIVKTPAGTEFTLMNVPYYHAAKIPDYIGYWFNKSNQNPSQINGVILSEEITDIPLKTQILQNILINDVKVSKETLRAFLLKRFSELSKRTGFEYHTHPTNVGIYLFNSEEKANNGMAQWSAMLLKSQHNNEPEIYFNDVQIRSSEILPESKYGLSENFRKEIWKAIVKCEDMADQELESSFSKARKMEEFLRLDQKRNEIIKNCKSELCNQFGIDQNIVTKISSEAIQKGWTFPNIT